MQRPLKEKVYQRMLEQMWLRHAMWQSSGPERLKLQVAGWNLCENVLSLSLFDGVVYLFSC